tara:strand:+ start:826 stop:1329 length:504 start_codon:yes stop_codon:yes gene_type:complete
MKEFKLESLLNNHIDSIPFKKVQQIDNEMEYNLYLVSEVEMCFFTKKYNFISLKTNKNNIIQSVLIEFQNELLDKELYNSLKESYGEPNNMQCIDFPDFEEITTSEDGNIISSGFRSSLKECNFEENPVFISWEKPRYLLQLTLYDENLGNKIELLIKNNDIIIKSK